MLFFEKKNKSINNDFEKLLLSIDFLNSSGWSELASSQAWTYYKKISPITKAVNLVATELSNSVPIAMWSIKDKAFLEDLNTPQNRVLKLLAKPNELVSKNLFMQQLSSSFLVTGGAYIIATGNPNREPLELYYQDSSFVSPQLDSSGWVASYKVQIGNGQITYEKDDNGRFIRGDNELIHLNSFSPNANEDFSLLTPLYHEIEQYMHSNIHNLSLLKRGARPSGVFLNEGNLDISQRDAIREQMQNFYQGSENAGNVMILSGAGKKDYKELSISNKDMDFVELKKMCKDSIYEIFNTPTSFYDNTSSSFNNKSTDKMSLYDLAVFPILSAILDGLNAKLLPRYKNIDGYKLDYIEEKVPALRQRYIDQITEKAKTGVFSINEIRAMYGYDEVENGDVVYKPASEIPIGTEIPSKTGLVVKELKKQGFSDKEIKELTSVIN